MWSSGLDGSAPEGIFSPQGSTQGHWRFPASGLEQGYAYLLTHPGTPCLFYDHLHDRSLAHTLQRLIGLRLRAGIHCRSEARARQRLSLCMHCLPFSHCLLLKHAPWVLACRSAGLYPPRRGTSMLSSLVWCSLRRGSPGIFACVCR